MKRRVFLPAIAIAAILWAATVAAAYQAIRRFESTPGAAAVTSRSWPSGSSITRANGEWTLVMLVHPHCSCSRASVQELAAILEKAPRTLRTHVLVYRPHEFPGDWERTDVYDAVTRLHRASVHIDADGVEAKRFGGFTSGQTYLYDGDGTLRFEGGITLLRGHAGLNSGRAGILRIASTHAGNGSHPVFGCAISSKPARGERR